MPLRQESDSQVREEALLRSLRLPELQHLSDIEYAVVVDQASRIVRREYYATRLKRHISQAREAIADGIWPAVWGGAWDYVNLDERGRPTWLRDEREPHIHEDNGVFVCWVIEVAAGGGSAAHLHLVRQLVAEYHNETPWGKHCPWGGFMNYGVYGTLRSWSHGGLVERVAPATWSLTVAGRELLAVVFGDSDESEDG